MSIKYFQNAGTLLAIVLSMAMGGASGGVSADPRRGDERRAENRQPKVERSYQLDSRHRHDRYYSSRGVMVERLPQRPIIVPHHGANYYFSGGIWYRPSGPRFIVTAPPIGVGISVLPPYYTTLWVGGIPYFYADGNYYSWRPSQRDYVVVEKPREEAVVSQPSVPEQMFVYPKQGQSEQQMADDRYECHRWAVDQTGFDPSQPVDANATSQIGEKRADYLRATKACLEAREYSVK